MEAWTRVQRWRYGILQCAGLGALAGGLEAVRIAASSALSLSLLDALILGLLSVVTVGGVGALCGLPAGVVHVPRRDDVPASTPLALHLALGAALLSGFFLWQRAATLFAEGAPAGSWLALGVMPGGFAGMVYVNARYWLRKVELDRPVPLGGLTASVGAGLLLASVAAATWPFRDPGGSGALEGDPNVVLVTVDGLRRDDVGAYGGSPTPALDALASRGTLFLDAVSPTPHSRPANAAVLAGLHPLRLKLIADDGSLSRGYTTIFEALLEEGWATGAFVGSADAATGSGLDQGFLVFDDDLYPGPAGAGALLVVQDLAALGRRAGLLRPFRPAPTTADRAAQWIRAHDEVPCALWVHLADPHASGAAGVAPVDEALATLVEAVEASGAMPRTTFVVTGTHGSLRGAHGGQGNRTLFDEVVRVPLVVAGPTAPAVRQVPAQVRTLDLASTIAVQMGLDELANSEGIPLGDYMAGERSATIWTSLVGQDLDGTWLLGIRNNGVKVIRAELDAERLFDLGSDPGEARDVAAEQPGPLSVARQLLAPEQVALDRLR